jgi:hypothetical protein
MSKDELNHRLASANHFHADSLPLNRNGQLSDQQVSRVRAKLIGPIILILLPLGILGYQINNRLSTGSVFEFTTGFIVLSGILLVLVLIGTLSLLKTVSDLREKQVFFAEGRGQKVKRVRTDQDGSDSTDYFYLIGEERFEVSRRAYEVLVDDLLYRAYYTPNSRTLVNIEALEPPPDYQE